MAGTIESVLRYCKLRLEGVMEYLDWRRKEGLASKVDDVIEGLEAVKRRHTEHIQEIINDHNLDLMRKDDQIRHQHQQVEREKNARHQSSRLAEERRLRVEQQETTIRAQRTDIESREQIIKALQDALAEKENAQDQHADGFSKDWSEGERTASRERSEDVIEDAIRQGHKLFQSNDFASARKKFQAAKREISKLPADRRGLHITPEFRYALAVSGAYVEDIDQARAALESYRLATFSFAGDEQSLQESHVQHLLAQVLIGLGDLREAARVCDGAYTTRKKMLPADSSLLHQTSVLLELLFEQQSRWHDADKPRECNIPKANRLALIEEYSQLRSLIATNQKKGTVSAQSGLAHQLLPVWYMSSKRMPVAPVSPADMERRDRLLADLGYAECFGRWLSRELKDAIIAGNTQNVIFRMEKGDKVVPPALHLAALFNELEIATLLVERGRAEVNARCDCKSFRPGGVVHGVTALHLAVGAQNVSMIRYLGRKRADFCRPEESSAAPPLWLLHERWLKQPGNNNRKKIKAVLNAMRDYGWSPDDSLNRDGQTMKEMAQKIKSRPALQKDVLEILASV